MPYSFVAEIIQNRWYPLWSEKSFTVCDSLRTNHGRRHRGSEQRRNYNPPIQDVIITDNQHIVTPLVSGLL